MKFRYFLQKYEIQNMNIHKKYYTRAARYYRDNLCKTARGEDLQPPPGIEDGRVYQAPHLRVMKVPMGFGSDDMQGPPQPTREEEFREKWERKKRQMEEWGQNFSRGFKGLFKRKSKQKKKKKKEGEKGEKDKEKKEDKEDKEDETDKTDNVDNMAKYRKEKPSDKGDTTDEADKAMNGPEKLQIIGEIKTDGKEVANDEPKKSDFATNFDEKMSIFKSDMKSFGKKLSRGWDRFSRKTKQLAVKSKTYFEREFGSNNPPPEDNRPLALQGRSTALVEGAPPANEGHLAQENLVERSERDVRVVEVRVPMKPEKNGTGLIDLDDLIDDADDKVEKEKEQMKEQKMDNPKSRIGKRIKIFEEEECTQEVKYI